MGVYNPIEFDGRVQRSARGLSSLFDVELLSVDSGGHYSDPGFHTRPVRLPARGPKTWRHVWFAARLCVAAIRRRPAVVYAHDYFMAFPGWVAARLSGARFVYDAHELIFPARGERLARRDQFWYRLERAVVRRAELVVAANAERAELMREHFGLAELPMVVRNIAAPPVRRSNEQEMLRRYPLLRRASADEVLAIYQGDMSLARGLSVFLDAAVLLPPNVRLILVGGGPDQAAIAARIAEPDLRGRVAAVGLVPRDDLQEILRLCDIGLISYPMEGLNNIYCAPNKIFEYAQAGLPMITTPQPPLRATMERYGIGEVVQDTPDCPGGDAREWAAAIHAMGADLSRYRGRVEAFLADHWWADDHEGLGRALLERMAPVEARPQPRRPG